MTAGGNFVLGAYDRVSGTQRTNMTDTNYNDGYANAAAAAAGDARVFTNSCFRDLTDPDYLAPAYVGSVLGVVESVVLIDLTPEELKDNEILQRSKYIARITNDAGTFIVFAGKEGLKQAGKVVVRQGSKYSGAKAFATTFFKESVKEGGQMLVDYSITGQPGIGSAGGRLLNNKVDRLLKVGKLKLIRDNRRVFRLLRENLEKAGSSELMGACLSEVNTEIAIRTGSTVIVWGAKEGITLIAPNDSGQLERIAALATVFAGQKTAPGNQYILLPNPDSPTSAVHTELFKSVFQQRAPLRPSPYPFPGMEQLFRDAMMGQPGTGVEDRNFPMPPNVLWGTDATPPEGEVGHAVDPSVPDGGIGVEPVVPDKPYDIANDLTAIGKTLIIDLTDELTWADVIDPENVIQITDQQTGKDRSVYLQLMSDAGWDTLEDTEGPVWFDEEETIIYDPDDLRFNGWSQDEFEGLFGAPHIHIQAGENQFTARQLAALTGTQIAFAFAVPEPTSTALVLAVCICACTRRARPRRRT